MRAAMVFGYGRNYTAQDVSAGYAQRAWLLGLVDEHALRFGDFGRHVAAVRNHRREANEAHPLYVKPLDERPRTASSYVLVLVVLAFIAGFLIGINN